MGVRSGKDYLRGLRDQRQVVLDGRVIEDVTTEPVIRTQAAAVAQFYDFQSAEHLRDLMTYETEEGERAGIAYLEPRSKDDLRRRAAAYAAWAEVTCGLASRSPDYMNTMITQLAGLAAAKADPDVARPFIELYKSARRHDWYWTHTFVHPFKQHGKPIAQNPTVLRVVRETSDGVVVSGARGIATGAPVADRNLNLERVRDPSGADRTEGALPILSLSFTHRIDTPGLRWICRDPEPVERPHADSPLAGTADELDAVAVFEEVLIPNDSVLTYARDFEKLGALVRMWAGHNEALTKHQALVRCIAKTRFILGLAHMIAESSQVGMHLGVQQRIGDIVLCLDVLESIAVAAIEDPDQDKVTGLFQPKVKYATAGVRLMGEYYPRILDHLLMLGASRFVSTPQERTFDALGEAIDVYFRGPTTSAKETARLYRMAWDIAGTSFGKRQDLYERFFANSFEIQKALRYVQMDKGDVIAMVRRMLSHTPSPGEPFPVPAHFRPPGGS